MACGCRKKKKPLGPEAPKQRFELLRLDGKTQTFARQLDAEAARVRAGGGTITVK